MKTAFIAALLVMCLSFSACTQMTKTQQGALSGGAIGAGAGLGIAALTGGGLGLGALLGGGLGAVAGGLYGNQQEGQHHKR
ncbi:cell envelope biogenesis protein OmpA [Humidesulfovibrio idahonensis]